MSKGKLHPKAIYVYTEIDLDKLYYGVYRPQRWWDEHPRSVKLIDLLCESIKKKGFTTPLCAANEKDDGTYRVNTGNHRLYALRKLKYKTASCIIANKKEHKNIPKGKILKTKKQMFSYFKVGVSNYNFNPLGFQISPGDRDKYDADKIFKDIN